jgi:ABC-2 type transport system ATP-binding protein
LVRRDILEAVISTVAHEGRSVFFSSHLLEEIERVSDHVAMLQGGKMVLCGPLDEIKSQHRRITLHFHHSLSGPPEIPGALSIKGAGKEWTLLCNGARADIPAAAALLGAAIVDEQRPSLSEIFVAHTHSLERQQLSTDPHVHS